MSQLRMFLDIEKHPLPEYPVPEGFRITRNGPEVAERYEILREGAGWGKLKPDFLTNKVIPKGLVFCEETPRGFQSPAPQPNSPTTETIVKTGAISAKSSALKPIAARSSASSPA
ncbi:MAG: hypothetical protein IKP58_10425 [Victivallales bacterium]|nr:hypothetical protein [Victivallales bacterium]